MGRCTFCSIRDDAVRVETDVLPGFMPQFGAEKKSRTIGGSDKVDWDFDEEEAESESLAEAKWKLVTSFAQPDDALFRGFCRRPCC